MTITIGQRTVLLACAATVAGMLIYPPLRLREFGRGYGWIFAIEEGLAINAAQLLVQWVGVLLVGGIAFVLAGTERTERTERADRVGSSGARFADRLRYAFRATSTLMWVLLAMVAGALLMARDGKQAALAIAGKGGAALVIFVAVFLWHFVRGPRAPDAPPVRTNWRRVGVFLAVAAAALAWFLYGLRAPGEVAVDHPASRFKPAPNPFDQFDPPARPADRAP